MTATELVAYVLGAVGLATALCGVVLILGTPRGTLRPRFWAWNLTGSLLTIFGLLLFVSGVILSGMSG